MSNVPWYLEPFKHVLEEDYMPNEKSIEVLKQPYGKDMNGHIPCQRCGKRGDDVLFIRQWHKKHWNHCLADLVLCKECRDELATALKEGEQE